MRKHEKNNCIKKNERKNLVEKYNTLEGDMNMNKKKNMNKLVANEEKGSKTDLLKIWDFVGKGIDRLKTLYMLYELFKFLSRFF